MSTSVAASRSLGAHDAHAHAPGPRIYETANELESFEVEWMRPAASAVRSVRYPMPVPPFALEQLYAAADRNTWCIDPAASGLEPKSHGA